MLRRTREPDQYPYTSYLLLHHRAFIAALAVIAVRQEVIRVAERIDAATLFSFFMIIILSFRVKTIIDLHGGL